MGRFCCLAFAVVVAGCSSSAAVMHDLGDGGGGGAGGDDMADGVLHVAPTAVSLPRKGSTTFSANLPVTWAAIDGGAVDANGRYTAPNMVGTFHVVATTVGAPTQQATATITVEDRTLTLLAGALGGVGGADDVGSAARLNGPVALVGDGAGNLYFADVNGQTVRKLVVATGAVTTIAGAPNFGGSGADGVGAAARFNRPWSVALDGSGHLYVGDVGDRTVRAIALATGAVTTLAGAAGQAGNSDGTGAAARFSQPQALAFDGQSALYVADSGNGSVRKIDLTSAAVSTVSTAFAGPKGLAIAGADTLYVADAGTASTLLKLTPSTGAIAIVAGENGVAGFRDGVGAAAHIDSPSALAIDGAGNLWLADIWLRKIALPSATVTTMRESTHYGVAPAGDGTLFVSSYADDTIARFDPASGSYTVIAGAASPSANVDGAGSVARFANPYGIAVDASGNLFVADANNQEIRRVAADGTVTTVSGAATTPSDGSGVHARFSRIWGIATDRSGTLYLSETFDNVIRKYDIASGTVTTLAGARGKSGTRDGVGAAARFDSPEGLCYDGSGALYIADTGNHAIRRLDLASGAVSTVAGQAESAGTADGTLAAARFSVPGSVACDATHVWVADSGNDVVRLVDLGAGSVTTVAGSAGMGATVDGKGAAARFNAPDFIVLDGTRLVLADRAGLYVRAVALADYSVTTLGHLAAAQSIIGVAVDGGGNVYVSGRDRTVQKLAAGTNAVSLVAGDSSKDAVVDGTGAAAQFDGPYAITFDGAGALYLAEDWGCVLRKIALTNGSVATLAGAGVFRTDVAGVGTAAFYHSPWDVAFDGSGALLVSDALGWTVDRLTLPDATLAVFAGSSTMPGSADGSAATFDRPDALVFDGQDSVYVADPYDQTVRRITISTRTVSTIAGAATMKGSADGNGAAARFNGPAGLALDGAGHLYVADRDNDTLRVVTLQSGDVATFAGAAGMPGSDDGVGGAARFLTPTALAFDGAHGVLYVADGNGTIRAVEAATAAVTTWAGVPGQHGVAPGSLPARLNAPRGLALLPSGGLALTDEQAVLVIR